MALRDWFWKGKEISTWDYKWNGWAPHHPPSPHHLSQSVIGPDWPLHVPSYAESFQKYNRLHIVHWEPFPLWLPWQLGSQRQQGWNIHKSLGHNLLCTYNFDISKTRFILGLMPLATYKFSCCINLSQRTWTYLLRSETLILNTSSTHKSRFSEHIKA
jgi:hypothetical protein